MALSTELRQYFDSVVIVDDDLDNPLRPLDNTEQDVDQAVRLFQALQEDGYVVSPVRYLPHKTMKEQIERVIKVVESAKMLVLDWRLTGSAPSETESGSDEDLDREIAQLDAPGSQPSDTASFPAKELIRELLERPDMGMKYVVIYTSDTKSGQATPTALIDHLIGAWGKEQEKKSELLKEVQTLRERLTQHKGRAEPFDTRPMQLGHLFITFIDKGVTPNQVLEVFSERLNALASPLSLVFLGAVGLMERKAHQVLSDYSRPVDVPVFMHITHNQMETSRISPFLVSLIWEYLIEDLNESDLCSFLGSLNSHRKDRIVRLKDMPEKELLACIQGMKSGLPYVDCVRWSDALASLAKLSSQDEMAEFFGQEKRELLDEARVAQVVKEQKGPTVLADNSDWSVAWNQFQMATELLLAYTDWPDRGRKTMKDFLADYRQQTTLFTRLLKCTRSKGGNRVRTGDVYRRADKPDEFLFCITPFCDTARPEKVTHRYKFLVGKKLAWKVSDVKAREAFGEHISMVPVREETKDTLIPVQWSFYQTRVFNLSPVEQLLHDFQKSAQKRDFARRNGAELKLVSEDPKWSAALNQIFATGQIDPEILQEAPFDEDTADSPGLLGFRQKYKFVVQFKKEYAQQIINKYLMYHSRAGVPELYFKERTPSYLQILRPDS